MSYGAGIRRGAIGGVRRIRVLHALLLATLLLGTAPAAWALTIPLETMDKNPHERWASVAGLTLDRTEGRTGSALHVTGEMLKTNLHLVRPMDIPQGPATARMLVRGEPGRLTSISLIFKDQQGWVWTTKPRRVDHPTWTELTWEVGPEHLKADWHLKWWERAAAKAPDRRNDLVFKHVPPMRFLGFTLHGKEGGSVDFEIDEFAIETSLTGYVHFNEPVVEQALPQVGTMTLRGGKYDRGQLSLELVDRNNQPIAKKEKIAYALDKKGRQVLKLPFAYETTGIYRWRVSGGLLDEPLEKQVQVLAAEDGVSGLKTYHVKDRREERPYTPDIPLSQVQSHEKLWLEDQSHGMVMYTSELSPAWLIKNNKTKTFQLFNDTKTWGLGGPTRIAIPVGNTTKIFRRGQSVSRQTLRGMDRSWMLVWFSGSKGYEKWDTPYLVVLQKRPKQIGLTQEGLGLRFSEAAGYIAVLPLYGGYRPPQAGHEKYITGELTQIAAQPAKWKTKLPQEVVERCDWWARVCKAYPVACDEQFSVDGRAGDIVIKSEVSYLTIADDWDTKPVRFAPIPPVLGLCHWGKTFPVTFDQPVHDPVYPTSYGPYLGIADADTYTYRMGLLDYIHEVHDVAPPSQTPSRPAQAARDRITHDLSRTSVDTLLEPEAHFNHNLVWGLMDTLRYRNSGILYTDSPSVRRLTKIANQRFFTNQFFFPGQYEQTDLDTGLGQDQSFLFFSGPGWGFQGDAGKLTNSTYWTMWLYAYATGDYQLIEDQWDQTLVRLHCLPYTMCWSRYGRDGIAEFGDEGPPPMGMARLAYLMGDMDRYAYACYLFAREMTHHYAKVKVGGDYFRAFQPIQPLVTGGWAEFYRYQEDRPIPQRANVSNIHSESAGWQLGSPPDDEPVYGVKNWGEIGQRKNRKPEVRGELPDVGPWGFYGSGQWAVRWNRFDSEDISRFYHDHSPEAARWELDTWLNVEFGGLPDQVYRYPSRDKFPKRRARIGGYPAVPWRLMQLRADILNETDTQIADRWPVEHWENEPAIQQPFFQAMVRSAAPRKTTRIIPAHDPTPFQTGLQRHAVSSPNWNNPVQTPAGIEVFNRKTRARESVNWPAPCLYSARISKDVGNTVGTKQRWSFGYLKPIDRDKPASVEKRSLNWVLDAFIFTLD